MTNTTACDDQDNIHWEDRNELYVPNIESNQVITSVNITGVDNKEES